MSTRLHPQVSSTAQRRLHAALDHYADSHQHPDNVRIHLICVPLIFTATLILLWRILGGQWISSEPGLGMWMIPGGALTIATLAFYARYSLRAFSVMLIWTLASLALMFAMLGLEWPVVPLMLALFLLAWTGQFIGHRIEGRKPAFLDDLRQLLIGPLFVLIELFPAIRHWLVAQDMPKTDQLKHR
ncbi:MULTISPECIES: DUF962 domain-containing protein [Cobetia]|uniref:DUF962 domain-containing protein n=1 Tax=Cobetia crustatorum TaxID=553385 RepID=A0A558HXM1_9GAMM|nr:MULTISPECIES: Mpo1-like protein [Cobetia]TVU73855.1 DUF962 domain-containing protein [Cobetia crustatorum]